MSKKPKQQSKPNPEIEQPSNFSDDQLINDFMEKRKLQQEALKKVMEFMDKPGRTDAELKQTELKSKANPKSSLISRIRKTILSKDKTTKL